MFTLIKSSSCTFYFYIILFGQLYPNKVGRKIKSILTWKRKNWQLFQYLKYFTLFFLVAKVSADKFVGRLTGFPCIWQITFLLMLSKFSVFDFWYFWNTSGVIVFALILFIEFWLSWSWMSVFLPRLRVFSHYFFKYKPNLGLSCVLGFLWAQTITA